MVKKGGHIILVGMSGAGKTTIGKRLSMKLEYPFVDTDDHIEAQCNKSISEIFQSEGEAEFRRHESQLMDELENAESSVISVGGGLPCHNKNMTRLLSMGIVIYLEVTVRELCQRLSQDQTNRPLYRDVSEHQLIGHTSDLLNKRNSTYLESDVVIESDYSVEEILDKILMTIS